MAPRGAFVAGVGTDDSRKQELEPELLAENTVVADVLDQCLSIGDLHHAHSAGLMTRDQVHAELAEVVSGTKPGRRDREEITVFDSTGTAVEDVAAAVVCYERASVEGRGFTMDFEGGSDEMGDAGTSQDRPGGMSLADQPVHRPGGRVSFRGACGGETGGGGGRGNSV
jgi:hypothetical protein